jgi:hypothetical protein
MMKDISPVNELIDGDVMRSEYSKDRGVDKVRWYLVVLTTVAVTTLTVLTIQAQQRKASVPHYDGYPY